MNLPNPQQVKNIVGHVGTAAGTAIVLFGLQAKGVDPAKVTAAIQALGDLVNTVVIVIGAIGGIWAAVAAASGSSATAVIQQTRDIATTATAPEAADAQRTLVGAAAQVMNAAPQAVARVLPKETKEALAASTVAVAANSETTNHALLVAVNSLDNVQGVVVNKQTSEAIPVPTISEDPRDIPKAA